MKIVGLTGGIGSGKSTVLRLFHELGASIYIADVEAKKLMNNNKELIEEIRVLLGDRAYKNNELDRKYISSIVFNDTLKLKALNELVHPKVRAHFKEFIKKTTAEIVIYEAAILFESGSNSLCDYIITVTANFDDRVNRIMKRDGVSKQQILERMKHQFDDDYKISNSNFVIRNNTLFDTQLQVITINNLILKHEIH